MSALDRFRMLSKALLSTHLRRILVSRYSSTTTQQNPADTEVEDAENKCGDSHYQLRDYEHLLENEVINRKQLRAMIFRLNRELQRGSPFAKHLTPEQMQELILLPSWTRKKRFLRYLWNKEEREWRRQNPKSRAVHDEPLLKLWTSTDEIPSYRLFQNCLFLRMSNQAQYAILERTMVSYFPFALKVVLDFAYDHLMTPREINKLSEDVLLMHSVNRVSAHPLNLHFCSFDPENSLSAKLVDKKVISNRLLPFPYEVSPKPVVDLIPKESLVYLTPEGDEVLHKLDTDKVYVLGALVDKTNQPGESARRAQELGVRSMRFPGSYSLRWKERWEEKPLHVTHCSRILSELARGCSWEEAVKSLTKKIAVEFEI